MVCLCECSGSRGIHLRGSDVMFLPKVGSLWFSAVSGQSVWLFHFFNNGALMFSLSRSLRSQFWHSLSEDSSIRSVSALAFSISKSLYS